ncbi:MAG: hypothetical protein PHO84_08745 [Dysgonamonadaceae bacterium]|jgi:hypothetical protein|nr:hypothetical protein [Dysgonamonadaceae bacterium]MDD4247222.1 hypothetical protein [Dysgonamonadaceae bacterium]MDD4606120.1 hypothetical protein [Dysgonamonadaceae bacterium]HUI32046.1 hypothetical protein [Dysgonamonadaceae bacterium]
MAWTDGTIENDTVHSPAQDYNIIRSNKPSPIRVIDYMEDIIDEEDGVEGVGKLTKITS